MQRKRMRNRRRRSKGPTPGQTPQNFKPRLASNHIDRTSSGTVESNLNSVHCHTVKGHPIKLAKLQTLVAKCCEMPKLYSYNPVKFANFVYFCVTHAKFISIFRGHYMQKNIKFANLTGVYFSYFKTFRHQILHIFLTLGCS
jgi:hypothetical protein